LTAKIVERFKMQISEFKLIPSSGGCFELTVEGNLIYSKLSEGKFPEEKKLIEKLEVMFK